VGKFQRQKKNVVIFTYVYKKTHRERDGDNICPNVVLQDRPLQLPSRVRHIDPLAGPERPHGRHIGKAGSDQLRLAELAHFPTVVEPDHIGRRHWAVVLAATGRRRRFQTLYDGGIEAAVNSGRHDASAEDGPFGQPLSGRHVYVVVIIIDKQFTHTQSFDSCALLPSLQVSVDLL